VLVGAAANVAGEEVAVGVVLVHGGGFAASCWELVLPLLETPAVALGRPTWPR
jgi:hypothetical protein